MHFEEKIRLILGNSEKFFNKVRNEDIVPSIKYLLFLSAIPTLFIILFSNITLGFFPSMLLLMNSQMPSFMSQIMGSMIGFLVGGIFYICLFVGVFLSAIILHAIVYLMGAKRGFENTYKAVAYGSTPSILFSWIPFVSIIFGLWSWYLVVKGVSRLQKITMEKAFIATIIPIIAYVVIILILMYSFMLSAMLF